MLNLKFYQKIEKRMNRIVKQQYYNNKDAYFLLDCVNIECIEGDFTLKNCIITLSVRWGVENEEGTETKKELALRSGLKTVKQICNALYTIIDFYEANSF